MSKPDVPLRSSTIPAYNRDAAEQIIQSIRDGRYCALLGPRFAGKSELLHFVRTELEPDPSNVCVYANLRGGKASTQSGLFTSLASVIVQGIVEQTGYSIPTRAMDVFSSVGFRGFLENMVELIQHDLVLMIDHLEVVPNDLLQALLTSLRALYMDQQFHEHRLMAVVSGALSLATLTVGESSPFRGIAQRVFVGDLAESENQALVTAHTSSDVVKVSSAARDWLLHAARGDPYLIALICDRCTGIATERLAQKLTAATVKRVMREFIQSEASSYEPLREAVQLVEDDPDLLRCVLILLERDIVPRRELPLPLSPDLDPLYLTGVIRRVNGDSYTFRNEIYHQFLVQHFDPGRVGHVLTMAGRWDCAIDYLEHAIRAGHERYRSELLAATINSMYAAENVNRTAHYLTRGLSAAFGVEEARVYYLCPQQEALAQVERLGPAMDDTPPIPPTISTGEDSLEARAYREGCYLREHGKGDRTVLCVPLSVPGHNPIGVVTICDYLVDYEPAQQRERIMRLLGYLNQAARAIQEASGREAQMLRIRDQAVQLEEKTRQLSLLHRISTLMQSMTDLEKILDLVLNGITADYGLGFSRAWLLLLNDEHTYLTSRMDVSDSRNEDVHRAEERAASVSFDQYVRRLLETRVTKRRVTDKTTRRLCIRVSEGSDDVFSRVVFDRQAFRWSVRSLNWYALPREFHQRFDLEEAIIVPLLAQGKCLGIVVVDNKSTPRTHTKADEEMLVTFANQAAAAITSARQRREEQRRRQLAETLREISTVLGRSLDLGQVLKQILEQVARVLPFDTASIQLLNASATALEIIASKGFDDPASVEALAFPLADAYPNVRVWRRKMPLRYPDVRECFPHFADPKYHATQVRGWLGAPLLIGDEAIGVITLDSFTPGLYTPEHEHLAMIFASQAAIAIQNARHYDDAQRRIRDLEIVNDTAQIIGTKLDTSDLLEAIVSQIAVQLHCTHCTLFFPQRENGELLLVPQVTHGVRRERIMTRRFKPGKGLAGWVFQHGKSLVLADTRQDPRFVPARENRDRPRSMLVAPVKVGDQTIGVISADQDEFGWFSESDRRLVDTLARHAGIAIERAIALELLHDIGKRIISVQKVDEILQQIVSGAIRLTNTTSGVIYLVSEDGKSVTKSFQHPPDFDHPKPRLNKEEGLTRQVVATGEMLVFPDIRQDARVNPVLHDRGVRSMIAIPLKLRQKVIGVLYLNDTDPHDFTETEVSLLSTLATQAAIAIENARLLQNTSEALKKRVAEMETLQEINDAITSTLELDTILEMILGRALELTEATCGTVYLVSESEQELVLVMAQGATRVSVGARLRMGEGVTGKAAQDGRAYRISDVQSPQRVHTYHAHIPSTRSELAVPMHFEDQVIGVINIESADTDAFSEDDEHLLVGLARQAAIAIKNARLFDGARRRIRDLEIVNDVAQIMGTKLDTADLLQAITSQIADQLNCTHCTLWFPQKENDELLLVPRVTHGMGAEQIMTRRFKPGGGLSGWVFQHGRSLVLPDARQDPRFAPARKNQDRARSMLVAPVKVGDRTVGVISADQEESGWFSESDRRLVDTLARQAGIAIERAIALELLHDISNQIISAQAVDDILQQIVSGAIRLTNTTAGVIYLIGEDGKSVIKSYQHPPGFDHPAPRLDKEEGITRQVIASGQMTIVQDIQQDARINPVLYNRIRSLIAIPLKLDERKVIGVLYLNDANLHSFTETEVFLLSTLATQAAIAIQNAKHYEALREAQDELLAAGAIAWMGLFGSEWSHTVAQRTFSIRNYVDALRDIATDSNPLIERALDSIDVIAQEIQDVPLVIPSPADAQKGEPIPIDSFVSVLLDQWCKPLDHIRLELDLCCGDVQVRADGPLLKMALQKLVDNATRHMPKGGTLRVESRTMFKEFVTIALQDTGPGIPDEYKPLFGRRRIPKREGGSGSGMGALLARFILRKYGGDLELVWSKKGKGTRLEITLPVCE